MSLGSLDAARKATYEKRAADDKERYKEEMESYSPPASPEPVAASKGGKRAKKDPNAPKRAMSAYILFAQAEGKKVRESTSDMGVQAVMKEVAARWAKLDSEAKQPWEKKAAADKQRYADQLAAYQEAINVSMFLSFINKN